MRTWPPARRVLGRDASARTRTASGPRALPAEPSTSADIVGRRAVLELELDRALEVAGREPARITPISSESRLPATPKAWRMSCSWECTSIGGRNWLKRSSTSATPGACSRHCAISSSPYRCRASGRPGPASTWSCRLRRSAVGDVIADPGHVRQHVAHRPLGRARAPAAPTPPGPAAPPARGTRCGRRGTAGRSPSPERRPPRHGADVERLCGRTAEKMVKRYGGWISTRSCPS